MDYLKSKGVSGYSVRNVALTYDSETFNTLEKGKYFVVEGKTSYGLSVRMIAQQKLEIYVVLV